MDVKVPTTEEHWLKYHDLCEKWGVVITGDTFMRRTRTQVLELLRADPYLNNMGTLQQWDAYGAWLVGKPFGLNRRCTISEALCTMKHAVRVWAGAVPVMVDSNDPSLKGSYPRRPEWL